MIYKRVPCGDCELHKRDKTGIGCLGCHFTGYVYEAVDVLAEFKVEDIRGWADLNLAIKERVDKKQSSIVLILAKEEKT